LHARASCSLPSKSLSWSELLKRTAKESSEDDVLGLAAQLAYYFFLALFPAVLFILALASFFTLTNLIDDIVGALRPIAPADVLGFLEEQLRRISNTDTPILLGFVVGVALWCSVRCWPWALAVGVRSV
jgi:membrane protein